MKNFPILLYLMKRDFFLVFFTLYHLLVDETLKGCQTDVLCRGHASTDPICSLNLSRKLIILWGNLSISFGQYTVQEKKIKMFPDSIEVEFIEKIVLGLYLYSAFYILHFYIYVISNIFYYLVFFLLQIDFIGKININFIYNNYYYLSYLFNIQMKISFRPLITRFITE